MFLVQDCDLLRGGDEYDGIRGQLVVDHTGIVNLKQQKVERAVPRSANIAK